MKINFSLLAMMLGVFGLSSFANAQLAITEKSCDISSAAKKGYLDGFDIDKGKESIACSYALVPFLGNQETAEFYVRKAPLFGGLKNEVYTFNKDLEFKGKAIEKEKVSVFKPWVEVKVFCTFMPLLGGLEFKRTEWKHGGVMAILMGSKEKIVKKVRPKPEGKLKYNMMSFGCLENRADTTVLAVAGKTQKALDLPMAFDILRCDSKVKVVVTETIKMDKANTLFFSGRLHADNLELDSNSQVHDWILLFKPLLVGGKYAEVCDNNLQNFTYIRISPQGKVVEKFSFTSPSDDWLVEYAYEKDGSVYLCGQSIVKDEATRSKEIAEKNKMKVKVTVGSQKINYTNLQLGKISGGKFDFLVAPKISDIPGLKGKDGNITGIKAIGSGDIFVVFQDYIPEKCKWGSGYSMGEKFKRWDGSSLIHFDAQGKYKNDYRVAFNNDPKKIFKGTEKSWEDHPSRNYLFTSADGKTLNWLVAFVKEIYFIKETKETYGASSPLFKMEYCSINLGSGEMSEVKSVGAGEKDEFYLNAYNMGFRTGDCLYFASENRKGGKKSKHGNKLLLTKFDMSK